MVLKHLDFLFAQQRKELFTKLKIHPIGQAFQGMPDFLCSFLWADTQMLMMTPATRVCENGLGYIQPLDAPQDIYHPAHLTPFYLTGYWIPEQEGQLFQVNEQKECPLIRETALGKEILFLIHPKSELFFSPICEQYRGREIFVPAIALSSFRTHVIALPTADGYIYTMVKLSLDATIGGVSRILSLKECACSVGMSSVLHFDAFNHAHLKTKKFQDTSQKLNQSQDIEKEAGSCDQKNASLLSFFIDDVAFLPRAVPAGGMIHRHIPESLLKGSYLVPFFALLGQRNQHLLEPLVQASSLSLPEFLDSYLLQPLAKIFVELIYDRHCSLEAHAQNLLLCIHTGEKLRIDFFYRDMGGVNILLSEKDFELLPETLQNPNYYYFENHDQDTGKALTIFSVSVLFNLTKQLFKFDRVLPLDVQIWKEEMVRKGMDRNWHIETENPDAHDTQLSSAYFCRYGYVEKRFGAFFLQEMEQRGIFKQLAGEYAQEAYQYFKTLLDQGEVEWFQHLIMNTYSAYRQGKSVESRLRSTRALIEKTLHLGRAQPRPFAASSKELFDLSISSVKFLLDTGCFADKITRNPFLSVMYSHLQNQFKHLDLQCEVVHFEYHHESSFLGPYPFGPTMYALSCARDFLDVLDSVESKEEEAENFDVIHKAIEQEKQIEAQFVSQVIKDPLNIYRQFRARVELEGANALFPELAPVVRILYLSMRAEPICKEASQNLALAGFRRIVSKRLLEIEAAGYPYQPMLESIETALCFFDCYERGRAREQELPPLFHSALYRYYSGYLQEQIPQHLLLPTVSNIGATDLLKVRGVPLGFLGVHVQEMWVDGFTQTPLEFWFHDINHTRRMWQYFKEEVSNKRKQLLQFSEDSHQYVSYRLIPLISISPDDSYELKNLKRMSKIILFEILHEEALPAAPEVLARALMMPPDSPVAIEVMYDRHIQYTMERSVGTLCFIYHKLASNFFDLVEDRKEYIVAQDCRTKKHVLDAVVWMVEELGLLDVDTAVLWGYLWQE